MTAPVKRGRRGPRRALTEDEILDAALGLLDGGGPAAASVRGIAAKVGVAPNAVYTYFPDKDAVIQALVERLLGEVDHDVFADRTQPWRPRVEALALELRHRLCAHPGAVPLMIGGPMDGPHFARPERAAPRAARRRRPHPRRCRPGRLPADRLRVRVDRPGSRRSPAARSASPRSRTHRHPTPRLRRDTGRATPAPPPRRPPSPATSPPSSTSGVSVACSTASPQRRPATLKFTGPGDLQRRRLDSVVRPALNRGPVLFRIMPGISRGAKCSSPECIKWFRRGRACHCCCW